MTELENLHHQLSDNLVRYAENARSLNSLAEGNADGPEAICAKKAAKAFSVFLAEDYISMVGSEARAGIVRPFDKRTREIIETIDAILNKHVGQPDIAFQKRMEVMEYLNAKATGKLEIRFAEQPARALNLMKNRDQTTALKPAFTAEIVEQLWDSTHRIKTLSREYVAGRALFFDDERTRSSSEIESRTPQESETSSDYSEVSQRSFGRGQLFASPAAPESEIGYANDAGARYALNETDKRDCSNRLQSFVRHAQLSYLMVRNDDDFHPIIAKDSYNQLMEFLTSDYIPLRVYKAQGEGFQPLADDVRAQVKKIGSFLDECAGPDALQLRRDLISTGSLYLADSMDGDRLKTATEALNASRDQHSDTHALPKINTVNAKEFLEAVNGLYATVNDRVESIRTIYADETLGDVSHLGVSQDILEEIDQQSALRSRGATRQQLQDWDMYDDVDDRSSLSREGSMSGGWGRGSLSGPRFDMWSDASSDSQRTLVDNGQASSGEYDDASSVDGDDARLHFDERSISPASAIMSIHSPGITSEISERSQPVHRLGSRANSPAVSEVGDRLSVGASPVPPSQDASAGRPKRGRSEASDGESTATPPSKQQRREYSPRDSSSGMGL